MSSAWRSILCPVDFSVDSEAAVDRASELAVLSGASLSLLHIAPVNQPDEVRHAHHRLELWQANVREKHGIDVLAILERGEPATEILGYLSGGKYDLAVMATHGKSGLLGALLGGVTYKVARQAPVSVLLVRTTEKPAS